MFPEPPFDKSIPFNRDEVLTGASLDSLGRGMASRGPLQAHSTQLRLGQNPRFGCNLPIEIRPVRRPFRAGNSPTILQNSDGENRTSETCSIPLENQLPLRSLILPRSLSPNNLGTQIPLGILREVLLSFSPEVTPYRQPKSPLKTTNFHALGISGSAANCWSSHGGFRRSSEQPVSPPNLPRQSASPAVPNRQGRGAKSS